jgi:hypothetical protein
MTIRRLNAILWLCAIVLAIGAVAAPIAAWRLPLEAADARSTMPRAPKRAAGANPALPPIEAFEPVWKAPLRRPLVEAPPVQDAGPIASDAAGLPVSLVGTVGDSLAMLRGADGAVDVRAAGEKLGEVEVVAVKPGQADVRFNGQVVRLEMPKEAAGATTTTVTTP